MLYIRPNISDNLYDMLNDKKSAGGTLIHGIGASSALDSSGERLSMEGLDISSLHKDAVFNFEHKSDTPSQIVGKILKAKKIFKPEDCEDQNQLFFWNKCQLPYLYIMGELFDAVGHAQAQDIAAMLRYDKETRNPEDKQRLINFSVEGNKLETVGQDVKRSIARKISLTLQACNKQAIAEEFVPNSVKKNNTLSNSLLKNESSAQILEKAAPARISSSHFSMSTAENKKPAVKKPAEQKAVPNTLAPISFEAKGGSLGQTKSGKQIHAMNHPREYTDYTAKDHGDAMNAHYDRAIETTNHKEKNHHLGMAKLHSAFRNRPNILGKSDVAPSQKVNGQALEREQIDGIYNTFKNKKKLLSAIGAKYPNMDKAELIEIVKQTLYKNEKELEEILGKIKV